MNLTELDHALRKLRLSGMADVLETRLRQAQTDKLAPIDLVSTLVSDELLRRQDRLFARRIKLAAFRDADRALDSFDFDFNKKMNRALVYDLATARFIDQREDVLLLGPPGTGKSHLAQAIGRAAIQQGQHQHGGGLRRASRASLRACVGLQSAGYYWKSHGLNELADAGTAASFLAITHKINGGTNGEAERETAWGRVKAGLAV